MLKLFIWQMLLDVLGIIEGDIARDNILRQEGENGTQATRRVQDRIVSKGDALAQGDRSPVTLADLAAQIVVSRRLAEAYPDDPLLAEEDSDALNASPEMAKRVLDQAGRHISDLQMEAMLEMLDRGGHAGGGERSWVLDPIDGTKGFLRGDQYAIALALVEKGRVVVGVLGCPNLPSTARSGSQSTGSIFAAGTGRGTATKPLDSGGFSPVRVDNVADASRAVFGCGFGSTTPPFFADGRIDGDFIGDNFHVHFFDDHQQIVQFFRIQRFVRKIAVHLGIGEISLFFTLGNQFVESFVNSKH